MNRLAMVLRAILLLLAIGLVMRKAWPGELLSAPLALLTLGDLLWVLLPLALGLCLVSTLVLWLVRVPRKRNTEWATRWIGTALLLGFIAAVPLIYQAAGKHSAFMDSVSSAIVGTIDWLIS
jgi:hypothetical protein